MAIRSGIAGQFGIATETTWGTFQTPDHWYEVGSESIKNTISRVESKSLRQNQRVTRTDRWAAGKIDIAGDVEMEVLNKSYGLWFKHMLGAIATTADGAGFKHTATFGDPYGLGFTAQVGRPDASGTVRAFSYTGCKIQAWELSNALDDVLKLKVTVDGQAESTSQALGTPSYPATTELFYFTEGTITIGGVGTYNVHNWSLQNTVGIKQDRYFIGSGLKKEQILNAMAQPQGNIAVEFTDLTGYNLYTAGTVGALSLTYQTVTTYDTAKPYKVVITVPNVRFDGDTPNLNGPEVLDFTGNFVVLHDGTNSPITIDYYTSDTTP